MQPSLIQFVRKATEWKSGINILLNDVSFGFPESDIKVVYYFGVCLCSVNMSFCSEAKSVGKRWNSDFPTGKSHFRYTVWLILVNVCLSSRMDQSGCICVKLDENVKIKRKEIGRFDHVIDFTVKFYRKRVWGSRMLTAKVFYNGFGFYLLVLWSRKSSACISGFLKFGSGCSRLLNAIFHKRNLYFRREQLIIIYNKAP